MQNNTKVRKIENFVSSITKKTKLVPGTKLIISTFYIPKNIDNKPPTASQTRSMLLQEQLQPSPNFPSPQDIFQASAS